MGLSQYIERTKSILTGCNTRELFRFKDFPIHTFEEGDISDDPRCDMIFDIGVDDGFVQLRRIVPSEILYHDTHMNAVGKIWEGMRLEIVKLVKLKGGINILELGGSNGLLNKMYVESGGTADWTIVEPQPAPVEGCTVKYVKGFF